MKKLHFLDFFKKKLDDAWYLKIEVFGAKKVLFFASHCLKITQYVVFEFLNFGIFHFLSY